MKKIVAFLSLFVLLLSSPVSAHVYNEKTLYDDIEFSEAKEEIVYLRGLDVIASEKGARLFKPQEKLTKEELAFWVASFKGLGGAGHGHGEASPNDLQQKAVEKGLINSLEGNATYADVNQTYFGGKAQVEKLDSELTKEEFALFMGKFLHEKVGGETLESMAGAEEGPVGVVEKVTVEEIGEGEKKKKAYTLTISGKEYKVSGHPKMLYGPVDLTQWEGKKIRHSLLITGHSGEAVIQIADLGEGQFLDDEIANKELNQPPAQSNEEGNQGQSEDSDNQGKESTAKEQPAEKAAESGGFPVVPVIGGLLLVVIVGWLFIKKR
jgi:hypothetical protein